MRWSRTPIDAGVTTLLPTRTAGWGRLLTVDEAAARLGVPRKRRVTDLVKRLNVDGERDVSVLGQRDVAGFAIDDQCDPQAASQEVGARVP